MEVTGYKIKSATIERTTTKEGKKWVEIIVEDDDGITKITLFGINQLTDITEQIRWNFLE